MTQHSKPSRWARGSSAEGRPTPASTRLTNSIHDDVTIAENSALVTAQSASNGGDNDGSLQSESMNAALPQRSEAREAARNSASLGSSLLFTSALGVIVSLFVIPSVVTEQQVGILATGEALASIALVLAGLGMDSYLRKEMSVRPQHASEFFSAVLIVRVLMTMVLTMAAVTVLWARDADLNNTNTTRANLLVLVLFCLAQFFVQTSESFAAMLQAIGQVRLQSRFVILSKSAWATMIGVGLLFGQGLWVVPAALIVTETAKTLVFGIGVQRSLQLSWKPRFSVLPRIIKAALPFLVTTVSVKLIQFLDVFLIRFLTGSDIETGYYKMALSLSGLALLMAPLVQWVVLPLASRAVARSRGEFAELVKRSYELILCAGMPLSLLLALNADLVLSIPRGNYGPAVPALRILSLLIVLSYVSMLGGTLLIADGRGWRVVRITFLTIGIDVVLNLYLIRHGWQWWGDASAGLKVKDGGAGIGAAIALVTAEIVGSTMYIFELRRVVRRVSDSTSRRRVALTLLACLLMVAADRAMVMTPFATFRAVVDVLVVVGALRIFRVIEPAWFGMGLDIAKRKLRRSTP